MSIQLPCILVELLQTELMALPSLSSQQNNTAFPLLPVFLYSCIPMLLQVSTETTCMCLVKWSSVGQARNWHAVSNEENILLLSKQSLSAAESMLTYWWEHVDRQQCAKERRHLQAIMAEESGTPYSCMNTPICASGSKSGYFKPFTKTDHSIGLLPALFYKSIRRDILG